MSKQIPPVFTLCQVPKYKNKNINIKQSVNDDPQKPISFELTPEEKYETYLQLLDELQDQDVDYTYYWDDDILDYYKVSLEEILEEEYRLEKEKYDMYYLGLEKRIYDYHRSIRPWDFEKI